MQHRPLLRFIEITARYIFICVIALMLLSVAVVIYLAATRVRSTEITREIPTWYSMRGGDISQISVTSPLRRAALRAELDHLIDPVPELRDEYHWRFVN